MPATEPANFGNLPAAFRDPDTAAIAVLPVPYDATSTWQKGADRGPAALLEASANMELYDIETDSEVYRLGIRTEAPADVATQPPDAMARIVRDRVAALLDAGKFVVTLGGEHSVTTGAVTAHARRHAGMCVLQIDAHADLRDSYEGSPFNHACVMARCVALGPVVQVGIRSMDVSEKDGVPADRIFTAQAIHERRDDWIADVIARLSTTVYITIDLDALDPAIMPSTGTPEPGGLDWYTVLTLLRRVAEARTICGFDIVELCPTPHNRAPDFLAAKLLYKLLAYRFRAQLAAAQPDAAGSPHDA